MEHVSVCICTFKRPRFLARLLEALRGQQTGDLFRYSIVVADNDAEQSAREVVMAFAGTCSVETTYQVEPTRNIALARNKAVAHARGNYLAFIDDDEFPRQDWLKLMLATCCKHRVAGVLGPVLPHFEVEPPSWVRQAGFYQRPAHDTGFVMSWPEARTGNVLLRKQVLNGMEEIFRPEFGTGGEDQDFFRRMIEKGFRFVWCSEAPAYEIVPPERCKRSFMLRRALLRGQKPSFTLINYVQSLIAIPSYTLTLPFLLE